MKRNLWKRTVSLLMSVVMLMSLMVVPAQAEGTGAPADAEGAPVQASQQEAPAAAAGTGTVSGDFVEIVTECPEGVTVEVKNNGGDQNQLLQNEAKTKWFLKATQDTEQPFSPGLAITVTIDKTVARGDYAFIFDYAVETSAGVKNNFGVANSDLTIDKTLYGASEKVNIETSPFQTEAINLKENGDIISINYRDYADNGVDSGYLANVRIVKLEKTNFTVTIPNGVTATYSDNGKDPVSLISGTQIEVAQTHDVKITATIGAENKCMQGFYRSGDTVRLSHENEYTFVADADPANNKYEVRIMDTETEFAGYENLTVKTEGTLGWTKLADGSLASGNQMIAGSGSPLSIMANKAGTLMLDYKVSSEKANGGFEDGWGSLVGDGLLYAKGVAPKFYVDEWDGALVSEAWDNAGVMNNFSGIMTKWETLAIPVNVGETVYFLFCNDAPWDGETFAGEDTAWIRNIFLSSGKSVTVSVAADKAEYGTVSGGSLNKPVPEGSKQTYTATAQNGGQFYGWFDGSSGKLLSRENTYTCVAKEGIRLVAKFGNYEAWNMDTGEMGELAPVVKGARPGDTVLLLKDTTVSDDTVVREGVTLVVPFSASDETGYQMGTTACARPTIATRNAFRKLTVEVGKTLTVNGTLIVGGVQHAKDQNAQGQTSGDYAEIVCNGTVQVANSGALTVYGKITGSGTTRVANGATVKIPYLVTDYAGGTNTDALYGAKSFPFGQYATINVQNTMVVEGGASVVGMTSLFFFSSIHQQNIDLIGTASGLIYLPVGSTLTATYDAGKAVKTTVGNIDLQDFGKTTLTISGGATGGKFDLSGYGSTGMYLNIPYTYDLVLKNGSYQMANLYRIMPGATVTVAENATLNVSGGLQVADGWQQADKSGKSYPSSGVLATNSFSQSGSLLVNGTLNINGTFGGVAQTTGGGVITTGADAKLNESFTSGSTDGYTDNLVSYSLPARIMVGDTLTQMKTGAEYRAVSTETWTLPSYTMEANRITTGNTVTINQLMRGKWSGKVTLTFEGCNPITAFPGEAITLPTPTKTGYTFAGWYNGETKFVAKVMPSENLTLTARWTANTNTDYTVQHHYETLTGGYDVETVPMTGTTGEQTMAVVKDKAGFTAGTVTQTTIAADGSTVVKIYYTRNSYTLTWDMNGGKENATGYTTGTVKFGADINKPSEDPTKTGYTFAKWDKYTDGMTMPANNLTVTAQWEVVNYSISYNLNGGTVKDNPNSYTVESNITLKNPTKEGYTFVGWSGTDISGTEKAVTIKNATGNREYTANWTANQYTITFNTDGGSEVAPITQDYGTAIIAPKDPTKTGYTFAGWDKEIPEAMPAENMTITAQWKINQYTITFNTAGGSDVAAITQDYGAAIAAPANPTKTGYTFAGWDKEIPETMPAENLTIKAQWKINKYTITFDTAGGSAVASITQDYGTAITAPANPAKEGYTFAGWSEKIPGRMPAENMTVKAQWKINQYTITFKNGETVYKTITQDYGTAITKPADPTKTGYTFAGWDKEIPEAMPAGDMTVTAKWTVNKYTVTFDANGGSACEDITVTYGGKYPTLPTPTKEGYTFEGWFDGETQVKSGDAVTITGNQTLTAHWSINTYTITYQVDGQTVKTESVTYGAEIPTYIYTKTGYDVSAWSPAAPEKMPARNLTFTATTKVHQHSLTYVLDGVIKRQAPVNYGTAVAVQADPTKTGYTFSGWTVSGAEPVDGKFTMPDNDVTIAGSFSANTYTVTFNANGGEGSMADQSFTYDEKQALAANGFTRTGWRFTGWKLGNTTYTDGQTVSNLTAEASSIVTLEAQWEHIPYTLKFVVDKSGKVYHTEQKYYGDAITPPEAPEKAGYRFDGWDREIPATMPDGNLTITAKWSSYLNLLIAMGDDFAGEKLGIARGYYQKMNGDQRGEYQSENEGLYNAFVTAVTNASVAALEKNVAGAVVPTNEKLLIEGKQIAELTLNGYDVETRLIDEDYPAVKLTTVDFLTVLFGYGEITSVQVGDQPEVSFKDGTGGKQMELMLAVARQAGVELKDSARTYISVLDGKSMPVKVNGKTEEGITYSVTYQLSFFNNTHKITWNANGGVGGTTTTGIYGEAITAPTVTRMGYTFAGWDKAIPETMGKTALTFTAQWTANTDTAYTVQHHYETLTAGYDVETVPMTGTTGEQTMAVVKDKAGFTAGTVAQATIAANGSTVVNIYYTRNSYTLTVDADNGTAVSKETYKFGTAVIAPAAPTKTGYTFAGWSEKIPETMPAENVTVTATWKINQYTITFNTDGGSKIDPITQNYGTAITAPAAPSKTGYTFGGWDKTIPDTMPANNLTIKAQWKINQYTITFDTDGGSKIDPITQNYGTKITGPKDPTKTGYTFGGWDKTIPGTMPAENVTVTAKWKINQYTITFDTDGGSEVESITQDYGTTIAKPTDPTKTGYTFAGWDKEIPGTMPAGDMTVTAKWKINQYTITFDTDGGSEVESITQDYGTAIAKPTDPTKTGYTFGGWDKEIPGTMPAGDVTVTATWKINQYTITFDTDGGSAVASITQDYGTAITAPKDPTKTGYTFAGWYTDAACTNAWNFGSNMLADHDMTLYARWVRSAVRKATITGSVELGNRPAVGAVVELMLGNRKIAATTADANGVYSFQTVETGLYNIVAAKDGKTRTALVNVDSAGSYTVDMIVLPGTDVSFEVRIEMPATPPAAGSEPKADVSKTTVGGLDAVADKYAESGKKVALLLTITPKTAEEVDAAVRAAIEERSAGQKVEFVDMTLSKAVDDAPATTISSTGDRLLTINIPFATSGVSVGSMAAYRCIDGKVETLTSTPNANGEFIEVRGGVLVVHTGKPATYAIGYRLRSGSSYGGTYSLTSGDGQNGKAGATLQFGVNSGGTKVSAVYVDGTQLGGSDYTVKGTIVRLKGVYTATLAQGYHFGTVYYDNGYVANFSFTLSGETSPRTADMGIALYAALALTSLTGMAWVGKRRGSGRES